MALDRNDTLEAVLDEYRDTAAYEELGDVAMARRHVTACRRLIVEMPRRARGGGDQELEFDLGALREQLRQARAFVRARATSQPRVIHVDFTGFRQ